MTTTLKITGMHCASCKSLIEDVCGDVKGVRSVSVDPRTGMATIDHDETLDPAVLVKEIRGLGDYGAAVV